MKPEWTLQGTCDYPVHIWSLGIISVTISRPDKRTGDHDKKWIIRVNGEQSRPYPEGDRVKLFDDNTPIEEMKRIAEEFYVDILMHELWGLPKFTLEGRQ